MSQGVGVMNGAAARQTAYAVLAALSFCHLLNDMMQSLLAALFPLLKENYDLSFSQIGFLAFVFNVTASLLQPIVGWFTDKRPQTYALSVGMGFSLIGLLLLAWAGDYWLLLIAAALVGMGSSVFHPDSSRIARFASGGRYGFAQSFFQVGGNAGTAIGPLLAAYVVLPYGQESVAWFGVAAFLAMAVLWRVGSWSRDQRSVALRTARAQPSLAPTPHPKAILALGVLTVLIFSKYFYMASFTSYYTFYLIEVFSVSVEGSQLYLFVFLGAVAAGTIIGGPVGDRLGRKFVIWGSILGVLPFTLILPYVDLFWTAALSAVIGFVLASAFSAILVYAQALIPDRVGMISGIFFGLAFGMGGLGAAVLGVVADWKGVAYVFHICSFLPLLGLLTAFLPDVEKAEGG